MGLSSLDAALAGLRVSQRQLDVISANIANVGTPGYTRKILPQEALSVNGQTVGVIADKILRNVNLSLERDLWTQVSASAAVDVQASYLSRVEQFHGPPDQELSIAAEISKLQDTFSALADSPSDPFLQSNVINQATDTAQKLNDLSNLIQQLRNDAQDEITTSVNRVNDLLDKIASFNSQISSNNNVGRTVAAIEDKRDAAVNELAGLIQVDFFRRSDGVMVVQTNNGVQLADITATHLTFRATPVSNSSYYPASAAALYVGDPLADPSAVDITAQEPGGKIGGLLSLRDETFPKETAQVDELAEKLAIRFDQQGLRLFTDGSGNLPQDTPPNSATGTPVPYVGFASQIRVSQSIISDPTLLQKGTYGASIEPGSNEVIRRVIQNTFGPVDYQEADGQHNIQVSLFPPPYNTLQEYFGLQSKNTVTGTRNLGNFTDPASFIAAANGALAPGSDTFRVTFQDANLGLGPVNIDVSLGAVPDTAGDLTQDIISYINGTVIPGLAPAQQADLTAMNVSFSESSNGQLVVNSNASITVDATSPAGAMGSANLALLGFSEQAYAPTDPYFDVQVGNNDPTRITIDSNDTEVDLLAKLNAVPGLAVDDWSVTGDGILRIRPGDDYNSPDFGGDMHIIGGPFTSLNAGINAVVGPGTVPDGVNIISALFGSFTTGPLQDQSPIKDVQYQSQTDAALTPPIPTASFRSSALGPGANVSTLIPGSLTLTDFAQKIVNEQSQQSALAKSRSDDEKTLQDTLQQQVLGDSGVNLDEELGNLIIVQTAYAASARVITAVSGLFQDLLNAVQ